MKRLLHPVIIVAVALSLSACFTADDDDSSGTIDFGGGSEEGDTTGDEPDIEEDVSQDDDADDDDDASANVEAGIRLTGSFGVGATGASRGAGFSLVGGFSPVAATSVLSGSGFELLAAPPVLSAEIDPESADQPAR